MGSVEQDLIAYQREVDRASDESLAAEMVSDELRQEIWRDAGDLESLMVEAAEYGEFPFGKLAKMLSEGSEPEGARDFIRELRVAIESRMAAMIEVRVPERLRRKREDAEQDAAEVRAEGRLDELDSWF